MENLFRIHHVADIIDQSVPVPSREIVNENGRIVPNPEYNAWVEKNWIVIGWFQAAVGPSMFPLVMNHSMARDCWKALDVHHSPRWINHSQSIRDELRTLKKLESESMGDFIIKVKALTDNLAAAGDLVDDRLKILFVADGLGPEFRPFMSSIHSQPNMLFEDFIHLVSQEEKFLKRSVVPESASALAAKGKQHWKNNNRNNRNAGDYRGRNGQGNRNKWRKFSNVGPIVCQFCDTPGHSAKTCRKSGKVLAAVDDDISETNWMLDSSASNHMTPEIDNMSDPQKYSEDPIRFTANTRRGLSMFCQSLVLSEYHELYNATKTHKLVQKNRNLRSGSKSYDTNGFAPSYLGQYPGKSNAFMFDMPFCLKKHV